jgi:hypothetical protein
MRTAQSWRLDCHPLGQALQLLFEASWSVDGVLAPLRNLLVLRAFDPSLELT